MAVRMRVANAAGLVVLAGLAVLFLGGGVGRCLGPLGVTEVQCISVGGYTPTVGLGMPVGAGAVVLALLLLFPVPVTRLAPASIAAIVGAAALALAYVLFRTTEMTGATSTGEVITVALPLDGFAMLAAGIAGGGLGFIIGGRVNPRR
jgi:hypothetical protein